MQRSDGFTLVELLVALALLGLVTATAVLTLPADDGLEQELERLQARLLRARELAVIDNRPVRLHLDAQGYRFEQRRQQQWLPLAALPARAWEHPTAVLGNPPQPAVVEIDSTGWVSHSAWPLQRGQRRLKLQVNGLGQLDVHAY